jgi:hypothetical protein
LAFKSWYGPAKLLYKEAGPDLILKFPQNILPCENLRRYKMKRKIFTWFFVLGLMICGATASLAALGGLEARYPSVIKIGENVVVLQGATVKTAVSVGGNVSVFGKVLEDVVAIGGSVDLKDSALVGGNAVSLGGEVITAPGAIVFGNTTNVALAGFNPMVAYVVKGGLLKTIAVISMLSFIGFLVLVVILVAVFTPQLGLVSATVEKQMLKSLLIGVLVGLIFIPIIVILAISIVGIILIPVWVVLVGTAALFGYIGAGHYIGKRTLYVLRIKGKSMLTETLVGVILLAVVGLIPFLGFIIKVLVACIGLGAVTLSKFGTVKVKA